MAAHLAEAHDLAKRGRITFDPSSWGAPGPGEERRMPDDPERRLEVERTSARGMLPAILIPPIAYFLTCIPLALGMIGPNGAYGVRTPATRASEAAWYAINASAGRAGMIASVLGLAIALLILRSGIGRPMQRAAVAMAVAILCIPLSLAAAL